jgi:hypothetical protein
MNSDIFTIVRQLSDSDNCITLSDNSATVSIMTLR